MWQSINLKFIKKKIALRLNFKHKLGRAQTISITGINVYFYKTRKRNI